MDLIELGIWMNRIDGGNGSGGGRSGSLGCFLILGRLGLGTFQKHLAGASFEILGVAHICGGAGGVGTRRSRSGAGWRRSSGGSYWRWLRLRLWLWLNLWLRTSGWFWSGHSGGAGIADSLLLLAKNFAGASFGCWIERI